MNKKYLFSMLTMIMVALASVGFVSCGSDDDDDNGGSSSVLVGEWQECESDGTLRNDATDYEVAHIRFRSDGTGDFWTVTKGKVDSFKYSFRYSGSIPGNMTQTITSSTDASIVGESESGYVTYVNGIMHAGEIYYKKISN